MNKPVPRPFLKWAGGKSRMLPHILERIPSTFGRYFEPFLGGGAVFFELKKQKRFKKAFLGDANQDLVNTYVTIRDSLDDLIAELSNERYTYNKKSYLSIRENSGSSDSIIRAAEFIYLNKTCFNGLYRVNKEGKFNVPFGSYKDPVILDQDNLRAVSKALRGVRINHDDFDWILKEPKPGDVVYFDPPYLPISKTSKFTSYTEGGFGESDHFRLAYTFGKLADKGVTVILSNSSSEETRKLYSNWEIVELVGARNVGGPAEYRKPVREIMVVANAPKNSVVSTVPHGASDSPDTGLRFAVHAADSETGTGT